MDNHHITLARQLLEMDPSSKIWFMWVLARSLEQDYKTVNSKPVNIETRRYEKLLNEAIARIPSHTPEWTNHNENDPGITLTTLFAYLAEFRSRFAFDRYGPIRRIVCRWLCS